MERHTSALVQTHYLISFSNNRGEGIWATGSQFEIASIMEKYLPNCPPSAPWPRKQMCPNRKNTIEKREKNGIRKLTKKIIRLRNIRQRGKGKQHTFHWYP